MWTNETWTTIWGDGNERKIIKNQILNDGDEEKFANDIIKYIQDKRYIRINNRPVFLLYQPQFFEKEDVAVVFSWYLKMDENGKQHELNMELCKTKS